ncbi:membrane dipeptidase [Crassaminicella thermophila]|uniref:Membrane dipeptidase n=1 Tax=Crassaminicella thermophila TaxID=2599308 RepID=A0A5C0SHW6_CRATE|nr:dipeptidase [Crassaminicella thermophila]QEK13326.1 membrane dipeptidase [Crassaminicella thermophila]
MIRNMDEAINRIHKDFPIVDAHFDLLYDVVRQRQLGRSKVIETDYLPGFKEGGVNIVVSSLYIDEIFIPEMALRRALDQISALYEEVDESRDKIMLCRNYKEIEVAIKEDKLGILLSFEGIEPLYNDLNLLRIFYELGVRIVGLTWSRRNYAADGCHFNMVKEGKKGGLTSFGVELIEMAEDLGMFIDVSHLNDEGFWDVLEVSKKTIIASHSNCRKLVPVMRNLTDEQIKAIALKNGVIGINIANKFVADNDNMANTKALVDHIDYIVNLVGIKHVGFGFDFCDELRKYELPKIVNSKRESYDILKGHKEIKEITKELIKRGYKEEDINMIFGENFLRVYRAVL